MQIYVFACKYTYIQNKYTHLHAKYTYIQNKDDFSDRLCFLFIKTTQNKYTYLYPNIRIFRTNIRICMQIYVYLEQINVFVCKMYVYLEQINIFVCKMYVYQFLKQIFEQCARWHFVHQNYQNDCVKKIFLNICFWGNDGHYKVRLF